MLDTRDTRTNEENVPSSTVHHDMRFDQHLFKVLCTELNLIGISRVFGNSRLKTVLITLKNPKYFRQKVKFRSMNLKQ